MEQSHFNVGRLRLDHVYPLHVSRQRSQLPASKQGVNALGIKIIKNHQKYDLHLLGCPPHSRVPAYCDVYRHDFLYRSRVPIVIARSYVIHQKLTPYSLTYHRERNVVIIDPHYGLKGGGSGVLAYIVSAVLAIAIGWLFVQCSKPRVATSGNNQPMEKPNSIKEVLENCIKITDARQAVLAARPHLTNMSPKDDQSLKKAFQTEQAAIEEQHHTVSITLSAYYSNCQNELENVFLKELNKIDDPISSSKLAPDHTMEYYSKILNTISDRYQKRCLNYKVKIESYCDFFIDKILPRFFFSDLLLQMADNEKTLYLLSSIKGIMHYMHSLNFPSIVTQNLNQGPLAFFDGRRRFNYDLTATQTTEGILKQISDNAKNEIRKLKDCVLEQIYCAENDILKFKNQIESVMHEKIKANKNTKNSMLIAYKNVLMTSGNLVLTVLEDLFLQSSNIIHLFVKDQFQLSAEVYQLQFQFYVPIKNYLDSMDGFVFEKNKEVEHEWHRAKEKYKLSELELAQIAQIHTYRVWKYFKGKDWTVDRRERKKIESIRSIFEQGFTKEMLERPWPSSRESMLENFAIGEYFVAWSAEISGLCNKRNDLLHDYKWCNDANVVNHWSKDPSMVTRYSYKWSKDPTVVTQVFMKIDQLAKMEKTQRELCMESYLSNIFELMNPAVFRGALRIVPLNDMNAGFGL